MKLWTETPFTTSGVLRAELGRAAAAQRCVQCLWCVRAHCWVLAARWAPADAHTVTTVRDWGGGLILNYSSVRLQLGNIWKPGFKLSYQEIWRFAFSHPAPFRAGLRILYPLLWRLFPLKSNNRPAAPGFFCPDQYVGSMPAVIVKPTFQLPRSRGPADSRQQEGQGVDIDFVSSRGTGTSFVQEQCEAVEPIIGDRALISQKVTFMRLSGWNKESRGSKGRTSGTSTEKSGPDLLL